eukprot:TRINITY_DN971_c0_g2_i1.p1 TRINITY_DN971_c0_g2~~TRINITY_DN971_c0_g2_i1.p1  ORF type:complete len:450 (+),score=126.97 TRINITY_DN971_c0_g2_i1:112-1350(+)
MNEPTRYPMPDAKGSKRSKSLAKGIKTKMIKGTLNPEWNSAITIFQGITAEHLQMIAKDAKIHIDVFDWNKIGKSEFMGTTSISLEGLVPVSEKGSQFEQWCQLGPRTKDDKVSGSILVRLEYDPGMDPENKEQLIGIQASGKVKIDELWTKFRKQGEKPFQTPIELFRFLQDAKLVEPIFFSMYTQPSPGQPRLDKKMVKKYVDEAMSNQEMADLFSIELFKAADVNRDNTVDFVEAVLLVNVLLGISREDRIILEINAADKDKDGKFTREEIVALVKQMMRRMVQVTTVIAPKIVMAKFNANLRAQVEEMIAPVMGAIQRMKADETLYEAYADIYFAEFDPDKRGFINIADLIEMHKSPPGSFVKALFELKERELLNTHPSAILCMEAALSLPYPASIAYVNLLNVIISL